MMKYMTVLQACVVLFSISTSLVSGGNANETILPTKSGIGTWVDSNTPKEVYKKLTSRGETWDLVMSDEFNVDGRNFSAGADHLWTALDIPDGVNRAMGIYTPKNVCTKDGDFVIRVDEGPVNISYFNMWSKTPSYENKTMFYSSAMVQTWNKFCLQGGFIEVKLKLPGAVDNKSLNPHVLGKKWTPGNIFVPVKPTDRIADIRFYPTWPGIWLMGNLGRALFSGSTNRMWPWTYNECDERYQDNQRISACDPNPGYGLNPNQGRGAPEIDILEGGGVAISSSIQIAPGMPDEYRLMKPNIKFELSPDQLFCFYEKTCKTPGANMADVPTSAFQSRGHKSWYQGLRYTSFDKCSPDPKLVQKYESVALAQDKPVTVNSFDLATISSSGDLHSDLSLIDGKVLKHWGINYNGTCFPVANGYKGGFLCDPDSANPKCEKPRKMSESTKQMEPFEYQMDAISSNWDITFEAYTSYWKYQIEWVLGDQGYIRWMLDDAVMFEIPASTLTSPPQGTHEKNPRKIMIEEPSYMIFNVAMAPAWGAQPPNWEAGFCRGNATFPKDPLIRNLSNNVCDSFPMYMNIDYIRIWQNTDTMSVGCDPASHPTKTFIEAHITNYTDYRNPYIEVMGKASCANDDDCTIEKNVTGKCEKSYCSCAEFWGGPRCTKFVVLKEDTTKPKPKPRTFGPAYEYSWIPLGSAVVLMILGTAIRARKRSKELKKQNISNSKFANALDANMQTNTNENFDAVASIRRYNKDPRSGILYNNGMGGSNSNYNNDKVLSRPANES